MGYMQNNIVSPFAMHQQQLAMLAQQQSLLMAAAAAAAASGDVKYPANVQQPGPSIPFQSWPAASYPIPGVMPVGGQAELQKLMQVIINVSFSLMIDDLFLSVLQFV